MVQHEASSCCAAQRCGGRLCRARGQARDQVRKGGGQVRGRVAREEVTRHRLSAAQEQSVSWRGRGGTDAALAFVVLNLFIAI